MQSPKDHNASPVALIIGRWQIFHKGHETLLRAALAAAARVVVVVGSAHRSRNPPNPFSWQERRAMIEATLTPAERERVDWLPVRDYYDDVRWTAALRAGVEALTASAPVTLVGYHKDDSSYYLKLFEGWQWLGVAREHALDATALRAIYFDETDPAARLQALAPALHPEVLAWLARWMGGTAYAAQVRERRAVAQWQRRWPAPVYLTGDVVLQARQQVLLVRRGGEVGHGLWALPGGFMEAGERLYATALRELAEETGLDWPAARWRLAHRGSALFDHPARSPRGRIITQAHHFDLGDVPPPAVRGGDDAQEARWWPIAGLPALEDALFDDHAVVLDHFVGVFERADAQPR